jgi:hypothetical protein
MAVAAHAQPAPAARGADPLDAKAAVPPAAHRSAMSGYRAARDTPGAPWKDANETVTRIGGWRVYLREAHDAGASVEPRTPAATPASPPSVPARQPNPQAGHGAHGKP